METIDGSAVEGEDYEPVNEILTFEPHEREKEVILIFAFFFAKSHQSHRNFKSLTNLC